MVEPSGDLQKVFDRAVNSAKQWRHEYVTLEHLLYAMLDDTKFSNIVKLVTISNDLSSSAKIGNPFNSINITN